MNVTRDVYRDLLINLLIPAINAKWLSWSSRSISIQQDGACAHILENDKEFREALDAAGLHKTTLFNQAANLPDTNVNDLGFFRAIQSASNQIAGDERELINNVQEAFNSFPKEKLNHVWVTLCVFNAIIEANGGNDYKLEHMGKKRLQRLAALPEVIKVTAHAVHTVKNDDDDGEAAFLAGFEQEFDSEYANLLLND